MPYFMIGLIPYIELLNLSLIRKVSIFEEYGVFNTDYKMRDQYISFII